MIQRTITRREIAAANDLSDESIARAEHRLGLDLCRDRKRPYRFHRAQAAERLLAAGYQVPED